MSKPFSDDAPQKMHWAIGSRRSVAVDLRHDIVKWRGETPHETRVLEHRSKTFRVTCGRPPDQSGCKAAVIPSCNTPLPGDAAGIWLLIIRLTLTRLEDHFES